MNYYIEGENHLSRVERAIKEAIEISGSITIAVHQLLNLGNILEEILGIEIVKKLKKDKKINVQINGKKVNINIITEKINNPIGEVLIGLFTTQKYTDFLIKNKKQKDFFYVCWTNEEYEWAKNKMLKK